MNLFKNGVNLKDMSEHWVEYDRYIWRAAIHTSFELNPEDFLECEDEDELEDAIYDMIAMETETGDVQIDESESELKMEDFLNEWKSLKGLK